ncbi:conjugal transfer protein [Legionella sp. PC997]|uniref:conjugal transfer protein n=1 Tax=Legionella sp. PC997 TaxID=2755562 RepID=UPI0015FC316C|nr:conjugal transfer protein [Legionella sp. PC997]QMT62121.1 hypothetical protein HBNCFIEN_03529 [Legionella sp. PC997]
MRLSLFCGISILTAFLTSCGTMNSDFSCNTTAGDSCLTIEQVDAMTRFADDIKPRPGMTNAKNNLQTLKGKIIKQNQGQSLWIARKVEGQSWA